VKVEAMEEFALDAHLIYTHASVLDYFLIYEERRVSTERTKR
jgi:hypothetical protein